MLALLILLPFLGLLSLASAAPAIAFSPHHHHSHHEVRAALSSPESNVTLEPAIEQLERRAVPKKRGLAYNNPALTKLFTGANSKISWMWNWDSAKYNGVNSNLVYCPILQSNAASDTSKWNANFATAWAAGSRHAFSFNEPDQCGGGGSCIQNVATAVAAHKQWVQPLAAKYGNGIRIGAPSVTNGVKDATTGSVMGLPWLQQFIAQCTGCRLDFIVVHWYDSATNIAYFKQHLNDAYAAGGGRPVYVTEFAPTSGTDAQIQQFLKDAMAFMDSTSWVQWYSYFMTAEGNLVNDAGNGLSTLGQIYNTY
ncbi:uncharacterized protein BDZ99DRAFT_457194 [Mytilinidion resinicola]|uniref:Asl1-like glycosyl hydrolase catalytic domain-containing protein n=1 Tax=Mytilinidion resinicola TaxID=574789 RepID=A0A6A6ZB61_9PEZI|nr:uncharacterized protein BDZ99DRAFT_457194 [Mytilinidion resinicola]KAF2817457.1 hypothetical protein BDZ99DRAFT_457194 [Mytilinidion resinicola]